jgi:uncharacterized membrane protein (DUF4010 family)
MAFSASSRSSARIRYDVRVDSLIQHLPSEVVGFALTLVLALLIGIEREEHEPEGIGGVRTFPIIGLGGFLLVEAFPESSLPFALGLVVLGALVGLSHWATLREGERGITTEIAALLTFTLGAAAARDLYWISIASGVITVILLQEKTRLEGLALRLPAHELGTLVRFLLLTAVILPAVPNQDFTVFEINPFKIWLVVVAVNGVSYFSYLLRLRWGGGRGLLLSGILGGAYSSTVTTVALSRISKKDPQPVWGFVGAITGATGVMYIRLWILIAIFAPPLARELTVLFWGFGLGTIALGAIIARRRAGAVTESVGGEPRSASNPLEMTSAFAFAGIFTAVLIATRLVAGRFGGTGVLIMAAIMGTADVDPFILGLTQYAGSGLDYGTAALAVVIAASANNVMKGVYAFTFGSRQVGRRCLAILTVLGVASIALYLAFSS